MEATRIGKDNVIGIVNVHMRAFPSFFLTFLGPRFLKEFYGSFLVDEAGVGFVAIEDGEVLGAIVGPIVPDGYFKRLLKRRWWAFCIASLGAVIKKPTVIPRLFRAVFYRGESPQNGPKLSLLSSIAVSPDAQGKGVGRLLVSRWLKEIQKKGSHGAFLTTDSENNEAVNGFYQNLGWNLESRYETPEGRKMNRYVYMFTEK